MTGRLQIKDVAERSGFSASTLRYYEDIGLITPESRSESGYRRYDERTLDRLAFIARAKQLGCTLEEIHPLAAAWDGGECGPVQELLRAAVARKLADTDVTMSELRTFQEELRVAAAAVERHRPDGPCDETCGCIATTPSTTIATTTGATDDAGPAGGHPGWQPPTVAPVACTLGVTDVDDRLAHWRRLLDHVTSRAPLGDGSIRLAFDERLDVGELARLVADEHACCSFFTFAITVDGRGVGLQVGSPDDAQDALRAMFG